jgi:hypothetical protein
VWMIEERNNELPNMEECGLNGVTMGVERHTFIDIQVL